MKWYIVNTRPRWEKKVHNSLIAKGIESFCPLNKVYRQWSDRVKLIEEPLFATQLFVKICDNDRTSVRMTSGVRNFVHFEGKPSVIREKEIQGIRRFLDSYKNIEVLKYPTVNDTIENGTFFHTISEIGNNNKMKFARFNVQSLGYLLHADLNKQSLVLSSTDKI